MISHPNIDPAIARSITATLAAVAREDNVRILLAVESGSRAWGFPSCDSDYDVRFIFARPSDAYLAVALPRDVIERPVDAVFDVGGWDIRKALQLALRSNAALSEWLCSPIRYGTVPDLAARLQIFAHQAADPAALAHHYGSLGRRSLRQIDDSGDQVRYKTYCYALRAALARAWLDHHGTVPPMDVPALLADLAVPVAVEITALIAAKRPGNEDDRAARSPALDAWLHTVLDKPALRLTAVRRPDLAAMADSLFKSILDSRPGNEAEQPDPCC